MARPYGHKPEPREPEKIQETADVAEDTGTTYEDAKRAREQQGEDDRGERWEDRPTAARTTGS